jgi:predicted Rossmann fold flavoprotein
MKKIAQTTAPASSNEIAYDVAVIGGGPAGMMAAGRAAERGLKVALLEKNDGLGKKLLITGGGRCNVTNAELDDRALLAKFKDSGKFLFSAFSKHSVKESLDFFHRRDMPTKIENDQRVFPVSNNARSVWEVLVKYMQGGDRGGTNPVTVLSNAEVTGFIQKQPGKIDAAKLMTTRMKTDRRYLKTAGSVGKNGECGTEIIRAHSFILATGGKSHPETGSTGEGFEWLRKIGHTVIEPTAALVPVEVKDSWVKSLSGISLKNAKLTLFQNGVKVPGKEAVKKGKVLFTHFGLSGPAILNMSSEIGELMKYGDVMISLDLLPEHDYATLNETLQKLFAKEHKKKFKNAITALIPVAFVPVILERSGIGPDLACNSVTREQRLDLVKLLKDLHITPTGLLGADKAIITSGGVALEEVDFRTMQSRRIGNLYLVGDILNIDRPSGGYSLQLCWTTGWVAGNSVTTVD